MQPLTFGIVFPFVFVHCKSDLLKKRKQHTVQHVIFTEDHYNAQTPYYLEMEKRNPSKFVFGSQEKLYPIITAESHSTLNMESYIQLMVNRVKNTLS